MRTSSNVALHCAAVPWSRILPLAFSQLVAWGAFYYAFAVIVGPMGDETGWTKSEMNGALSAGLVMSGLPAYAVGRWIDRNGGRWLMAAGAILGAVALLLWSQVTELWQLYAIWIVLGVASAMTLYEAAFAVAAHMLPGSYRRAITVITLLGGLASTAFIPLTSWLTTQFGWRDALIILAFIELAVCAPIPWLILESRPLDTERRDGTNGDRQTLVVQVQSDPVFWLLLASYVSFAFFYTSLLFNLLPLLTDEGLSMAGAVALYAMIGPAQVAGRLGVFAADRILPVATAGIGATLLPVAAMLILLTAAPSSQFLYLFPILFGAGMGIKTVVQATAAPEFLGIREYGALQGLIVMPVQLAQAVAPFAAALLWQWLGGYGALEAILLVAAGISAIAFGGAAAMSRRRARG